MSSLLFCAVILINVIQSAVAPPPGLNYNQSWNPSPGCPNGGVYTINNNSIRCHCWGFQGYICEPNWAAGRGGRGFGGGSGGGGGGGGNGCPPGTSVCVINSNSNSNANANSNSGANGGNGRKGNSPDYGSDYANYDG